MRLILIGCEYVGTTTLAASIEKWAFEHMGATLNDVHAHWKWPHIATKPVSESDQVLMMQLSPEMKELTMRTNLEYHMHPLFYRMDDHVMIGHYIEEAIYGELYLGYGGPGGIGDRSVASRSYERTIMEFGSGTTLVHLKATPEVIRKRMKSDPHQRGILQDKDVEYVLDRFAQAYHDSPYYNPVEIDTGTATPDEVLEEWVDKMDPFWTEVDRLRLLTHRKAAK